MFGWGMGNSSTLCGTMTKWLALALLLIPSGAAWGQQYCAPDRKPVIEQLHNKYNEVPVVRGLTNNSTMFEVFASPTGSWTILITRSDGVTYLINKRVKEVEQSLNSHKLFAAEHYVTAMVIEKMEARISEQFNRLYARLDQLQQTE